MGLKFNQMFPSNYLRKDDVPAPTPMTIADVRLESIKSDGGTEDKTVLHFVEDFRPMILNVTNGELLRDTFGIDADGWLRQTIEVYLDPGVTYGGKRTGGLRIRIPGGTEISGTQRAKPATDRLDMDQAVTLAGTVGMDKDALIAAMKLRGLTAYNPVRDAQVVRDIVEQARAASVPLGEEEPDDTVGGGDDIPF